MHKTNQGLDDLERPVSLVLAPTTNQLREHIRQAKTAAQDNPGAADETVRSLLRRAQPLLNLLDLLHGQGNASRDDLFDEVAAVCLSCAIEHQLKTHDDQIFVALLQQALLLAASVEVKQRIEKNIGIGKGNLARKKFDPIYEKLSEIEKSSEPPQAKLARVRNEIVPQLEAWSEQDSVDDFPKAEIDALSELSNSVAIVLRGISIEANNNHDDMGTAANAIVLAGVYTKEKELEKRVAAQP